MKEEKRYRIRLTFSGGDEIHATSTGRNCNYALEKLKETQQYKDFVEEHFGESIVEKEIIAFHPKPKDNNFTITNVPYKNEWYMVDHKEAGIRLEFKMGLFNTHQNVFLLNGNKEVMAMEYATAVREIADWLQEYFPQLIREKRVVPRNEGIKPGRENKPNAKSGMVPCYFSLKPHVAEFIKEQSKIYGMSQGEFIEWMMTEDEEGGEK